MAPARSLVFLSQKPSTKNGIIWSAILFLAWYRVGKQTGEGVSSPANVMYVGIFEVINHHGINEQALIDYEIPLIIICLS